MSRASGHVARATTGGHVPRGSRRAWPAPGVTASRGGPFGAGPPPLSQNGRSPYAVPLVAGSRRAVPPWGVPGRDLTLLCVGRGHAGHNTETKSCEDQKQATTTGRPNPNSRLPVRALSRANSLHRVRALSRMTPRACVGSPSLASSSLREDDFHAGTDYRVKSDCRARTHGRERCIGA
jgi:hypothetical protein